jgi:class 3 adenylate cyclase
MQDFDLMTEKLGDNIMDYINDIASVVHENVSAWGGQCNKNLGGSFLMTWKVPELYTRGVDIDVSRIPYIAKIVDRALIGFLKVIADLNRNEKILAYRRRADLRVEDKATGKITPFQVRMGFGLHVGWGIEGPVGTVQKVDATYLSPHVNMAARCETAAKQWHVPVSFILCYTCILSNTFDNGQVSRFSARMSSTLAYQAQLKSTCASSIGLLSKAVQCQ